MREIQKRIDELKLEHCTPKLQVKFHVIDDEQSDYKDKIAKIDETDSSDVLNVIFVT